MEAAYPATKHLARLERDYSTLATARETTARATRPSHGVPKQDRPNPWECDCPAVPNRVPCATMPLIGGTLRPVLTERPTQREDPMEQTSSQADAQKTVGLIGLGLLGQAMARRLLAAGHPVSGYDHAEESQNRARDAGVDIAGSARDAAARCPVIFLSLPDSDVVREVLWGADGIAESCRPGSVILDTTTAAPAETVDHHRRLADRGVRFIDLPILGSSAELTQREVIAVAGDTEDASGPYHHLVDAFAKHLYFLGAPGLGHRAKLVSNLVLGLNRLVMAEGIALAEKCGLDARRMLEILRESSSYSRAMDIKGDRMLDAQYDPPAARLAQHAKDVRLIRELARDVDAPHTPLRPTRGHTVQSHPTRPRSSRQRCCHRGLPQPPVVLGLRSNSGDPALVAPKGLPIPAKGEEAQATAALEHRLLTRENPNGVTQNRRPHDLARVRLPVVCPCPSALPPSPAIKAVPIDTNRARLLQYAHHKRAVSSGG